MIQITAKGRHELMADKIASETKKRWAKKKGGAGRDTVNTAQCSPQNGAENNQANGAGQQQIAAARDGLELAMRRAVAASGLSREDFMRLPAKEKNAYLAQASGAPKADDAERRNVRDLPVREIVASPFNRDVAAEAVENGEEWQRFCENIHQHGVIQPLIVRRRPDGGGYELIAGERRWRGAMTAGLETVPVIVREGLTDEQVIELQIIENIQRADLKPLDEARNYKRLRELGLSVEEIGAKVGRKKSAVYARLALLELPAPALKAVESGKLPASHAEEIGKIADPAVAAEVVKKVLHPERWQLEEGETVMPFRKVKELVEEETDALANRADYDAKKAVFEKNGWRVLTPEECKQVWPYDSEGPSGSKYEILNAWCYDVEPGKKWAQLVGKHPERNMDHRAMPILGHTRNMKPVECYERAALRAAAEANGHKFRVDKPGNDKAAQSRKREHAKQKRETWKRLLTALVASAERGGETDGFLRTVAAFAMLHGFGHKTRRYGEVLERRGLTEANKHSPQQILGQWIGEGFNQKQLRGFIIECIAWTFEPYDFASGSTWERGLVELCKAFKVDAKGIEDAVRASGKAGK